MAEIMREYQETIYTITLIIAMILMTYNLYYHFKKKFNDNSKPDANSGTSNYGNTGIKKSDNTSDSNSGSDFSAGGE